MEFFSEIYGCYYNVVAKILAETIEICKTEAEITDIINSSAFSESAFYILPKLISGEWNLLKREDKSYFSMIENETRLPVTHLQKSWLAALLRDKRIKLFLDNEQIERLNEYFADTEPLFNAEDFHYFDVFADSDPYDSEDYQNYFREVLEAYKSKQTFTITFEGGKGNRISGHFIPCRIEYSSKDDKFRIYAVRIRYGKIATTAIINMARITNIEPSKEVFDGDVDMDRYFKFNRCGEPVVIEISNERNALERCMLHFANYEKHTEYDDETDKYICHIYYNKADETELLIRVLSFGPVIKVLGPAQFLEQVKFRVARQYNLLFLGGSETIVHPAN